MNSFPIANPESFVNKYIDNKSIKLCSILGIGAYGVVYLGRHIQSKRTVAVKLLSPESRTYKTEIQLHAHVSHHDNILSLKKVVKENGHIFIVLEFAAGGDLFSAITKNTHDIVGNNDKIKELFLQLLDAVHHCHMHGVSHRDLKPENILLTKDLQIKLADFGLATTRSVSADFGCGSTFYFSPECQSGLLRDNKQINGYGTQANDVWSLGVILINLVTGRNPWRQANLDDSTFAAYVDQPKGFFTTILPSISAELDDILQRIFCLDPAHRISIPELKWRIAECPTFLCDVPAAKVASKRNTVDYTYQQKTSTFMYPSNSVAQSIMNYTDVFAYTPVSVSPLMAPSSSCSTSSSTSSLSSLDCPGTPQLSACDAVPRKISHNALVDLIQDSYQTFA